MYFIKPLPLECLLLERNAKSDAMAVL